MIGANYPCARPCSGLSIRTRSLVTDALSSYRGIAKGYRGHIVVNHTKAFSDFKGTTTNEVETYFATLKRAFRAFGRVQSRNAWAYLAEIEQRYNRRRCSRPLFETLTATYPKLDHDTIATLKKSFDMRTLTETLASTGG